MSSCLCELYPYAFIKPIKVFIKLTKHCCFGSLVLLENAVCLQAPTQMSVVSPAAGPETSDFDGKAVVDTTANITVGAGSQSSSGMFVSSDACAASINAALSKSLCNFLHNALCISFQLVLELNVEMPLTVYFMTGSMSKALRGQ